MESALNEQPGNNILSADSTTEYLNSTATSSVSEETQSVSDTTLGHDVTDSSNSERDNSSILSAKKSKRINKSRHGKKPTKVPKETDRCSIRRVHHLAAKFKAGKKKNSSFPTLSKFFLPLNRPRKESFIPPTKFLLGGNISDPLNLNSLQDEDINRAMNAVTPKSSPLPTPPRHKGKIDVIIPPNIRDPLNLLEPLDNEEYEKRLEMQRKRLKKTNKRRRKNSEGITSPVKKAMPPPAIITSEEPVVEEASTSRARKRSASESESSQMVKPKDLKKFKRMDSLDKIVSPVVPQPGAWKRVRPPERPVSPHRLKTKPKTEGEPKLPKFNLKNTKYQYGNYDRYYGYRNLNAMMDVRLQVFEMHKHLFYNKDILDIGCNVGHISIAVARSLGARSVLGIDIDPTLIGRARKNLRSFVPVPTEQTTANESLNTLQDTRISNDSKLDCINCGTSECQGCCTAEGQIKVEDDKKPQVRKIRRPRKNRKAQIKQETQQQCYFPTSLPMMYGPLQADMSGTSASMLPSFPYNITFKQGNYVPREELEVVRGGGGLAAEGGAQFDLILCLSTSKWLHLNWGDAGLKRAFRRMFADLRPGGKLVLEAQNWPSYKKKKRLTPTIYENFNGIELFPSKFREYLLSPEVGFSKCCVLGVPQHASKGFRRPIHLYVKGDFTPSKARWSDAYVPPSSHHKPEAEVASAIGVRRPVYPPAYLPSDETPSCGAATPYSPHSTHSPNLDEAADSPFYTPRSDSYAPSYEPPAQRPTVYAELPSPHSPLPEPPKRSPRPEPPKCSPRSEPPKYSPRSEPPKYSPRSEPPKYSPRSEPPKYSPRSEPPKCSPRSEPPKYSPRSEPPKYSPRSEPPKRSPLGDTPPMQAHADTS